MICTDLVTSVEQDVVESSDYLQTDEERNKAVAESEQMLSAEPSAPDTSEFISLMLDVEEYPDVPAAAANAKLYQSPLSSTTPAQTVKFEADEPAVRGGCVP